jgi:hypothetical protein
MILARAFTFALVFSAGVGAFAPSSRLGGNAKSTSNLHMSAALIVQNKGGGHGELGKINDAFFSVSVFS